MDDELLRTIFATAAVGVAVADPDGKHLAGNPALERMLGYSAADLAKRRIVDSVHPEDRETAASAIAELVSGIRDKLVLEHRFVRKNGEAVWGRVSAAVVRNEAGAPLRVIAVIEDIDERKRAEEELEDSEEKLLAVFTSSPAGMAVTRIEDGRLCDLNQEFEKIFECRRDDVVGRTTTEMEFWVDPRDRERVVELIENGGEARDVEVRMRAGSGKVMTMSFNAHPVTIRGSHYLISAFTDISERKQAEEQTAMLKHSIDIHPDGAYWMDSDNRCFYVNDAGCRAVGYTREELVGKDASFLNPQATPEALDAVWERLRSDGSFLAESVHRRKDGSEFPVELMATYVQFGGKEYNCGFARDVSDRKRQEQETAQLTEQLTHAQKMEAVGRLAGGVAHNFNNILTALVGYCELLLEKIPKDSDYRSDAEQIKLAADHATAVTRELLLFSRREPGTRVEIDLNTVVVQTRLLLRQLLRSNIDIITALAPTVAPVKADRNQIEQVLVNLVLNASDAMPNGGVVGIETGNVSIEKEPTEGAALAPGRYVTLAVKDNGTGMDEETLARIFDPFFTTKGPDGGTGLGLSTVYGIVEESGGRVLAESKPGSGSAFTVYLPVLLKRG